MRVSIVELRFAVAESEDQQDDPIMSWITDAIQDTLGTRSVDFHKASVTPVVEVNTNGVNTLGRDGTDVVAFVSSPQGDGDWPADENGMLSGRPPDFSVSNTGSVSSFPAEFLDGPRLPAQQHVDDYRPSVIPGFDATVGDLLKWKWEEGAKWQWEDGEVCGCDDCRRS